MKWEIVAEKSMSIVNINRTIVFFCIFPAWVFLSEIPFFEKIIFALPFIFLIIIFNYLLNNQILKKYKLFLFSSIFTFGIDQNLLLEKKFIKPNLDFFNKIFLNIYLADLLLLFIIFILVLAFTNFFKKKSSILLCPFIIIISLFNYYEIIFTSIKIQNFDLSNNLIENKYKKKTLLIILDEMSGINSSETNLFNGNKFKKKIHKFAESNNLILYPNAYSLSFNTATSVPAIMNFINDEKNLLFNRKDNLIKSDKEFYNEYILKKNLLFNKFINVSVFQNIHLNFCNHTNVKKCYQFNPYKNHDYFISGYKNSFITKFLSVWKLQGAVSSKLFWRLGRQILIADSFLEPEIHKATFEFLLNEIREDLISDKFDFVFAHLMSPHVPYGFNEECNYDGKLSLGNTLLEKPKKIIQHNQERFCTIYYLDNFFHKIKKQINYKDLEIIIMSDHGSRISSAYDSRYSSIFIYKSVENKFSVIDEVISVQSLVKKILGN